MAERWRSVQFQEDLAEGIPAVPGVYAIVRVRRIHALPFQLEMIYASETLNLRQRFRRHVLLWRERDRGLRTSQSNWEFWFRKLPRKQLEQVKREIIRHAKPPGNILQYQEERGNKQ